MAACRRKGKSFIAPISSFLFSFLFLYFHLFSWLVLASEINPSSFSNLVTETDDENHNIILKSNFLDCKCHSPDFALLKKQQLQLETLEELVKNLTHLISRLESQIPEAPEKLSNLILTPSGYQVGDVEKVEEFEGLSDKQEVLPDRGGVGPVLVTKYNTLWSERFQFVSAVRLSSSPSCINVLPYKDFEGLNKYFAVGGDKGKFYVFLRSGDVSLEFNTFLESEESSPVTAMVSYLSVYKNESMIVVGHGNGVIVMLRVWEVLNGDDWSSLHVERVCRFEMPEGGGSRINLLEVHHVGRKRYILATDDSGRITVYMENGMFYGAATPRRRPIVFLKQRLLFLTETGAGSLDLRTMKLKESECEGLNNSFVKSYVFDAMDRSKAYGFTLDGDLVQTLLLGDMMNFKCRVRSKRKLDLDEPLALQAIKGYLLLANRERVFVYNVSSQQYVRSGGLRLLFSADLDEIIAYFLNKHVGDVKKEMRTTAPLITSDHERLVIVSLGNGYVAIYRSNLPLFKNGFNSVLWTSPVLFFILFLFGAWHFFANKKEALTSWGPDDPFTSGSVTSGAPLGSSNGDRSFTDSSRNSEIMDIRGSGLRGPSRRYGSPPRYPGGATNSYRPGPDMDSRPASVDSCFRTTSEMKFRGSAVETAAGVPKRRDSLFVNSQVVDDDT